MQSDDRTRVTNDSALRRPAHGRRHGASAIVAAAVLAALLTGCGEKKDRGASQTVAKVNKDEITVHQVNFLLAQQRALRPEDAASASHQALERLIDQQLTLDKAEDQRLDRDPAVVQQIEASRRDIISRAYLQKVSETAPGPTQEEVRAYYDAHPALFKDRRIYNLQEVDVEATPAQVATLQAAFPQAKTFAEFVTSLNAGGFKFRPNQGVRTAEELPMTSLAQFATMKDDQSFLLPLPGGVQVVHLVASRAQPLTLQQASPAIEQFLRNERKRQVIADNLQALRGAARIEYVGAFSKSSGKVAGPAVTMPSAEIVNASTLAPAASAPAITAAVEPPTRLDEAAIAPPAASMPSRTILDKGLRGLK